jgi:O-antigen/teichoic acid export membrane protein
MFGFNPKKELLEIFSAAREVRLLVFFIFLVGMHSLILGIFIFFFTELFYRVFFQTEIENLFFVRQSGLFLFCLGLFYLSLLIDFKRRHRLIVVAISTKVLAVAFLVTNACLTARPAIIIMSAAGDGSMALLVVLFYRMSLPWLKANESDRQ